MSPIFVSARPKVFTGHIQNVYNGVGSTGAGGAPLRLCSLLLLLVLEQPRLFRELALEFAWFGVWDLGFGNWGWGLGIGVWGFGCRF